MHVALVKVTKINVLLGTMALGGGNTQIQFKATDGFGGAEVSVTCFFVTVTSIYITSISLCE